MIPRKAKVPGPSEGQPLHGPAPTALVHPLALQLLYINSSPSISSDLCTYNTLYIDSISQDVPSKKIRIFQALLRNHLWEIFLNFSRQNKLLPLSY